MLVAGQNLELWQCNMASACRHFTRRVKYSTRPVDYILVHDFHSIFVARRVDTFTLRLKLFHTAMLSAICRGKSAICRVTSASIYFYKPAVISLSMYITFLTHNRSKLSPINATIYGLCHLFLHAGPCLIGVTLALVNFDSKFLIQLLYSWA